MSQGRVSSPVLFAVYIDGIIDELEVVVWGRFVGCVLYTDGWASWTKNLHFSRNDRKGFFLFYSRESLWQFYALILWFYVILSASIFSVEFLPCDARSTKRSIALVFFRLLVCNDSDLCCGRVGCVSAKVITWIVSLESSSLESQYQRSRPRGTSPNFA